MLHPPSGSRERWTLALSPLSPFHSVWDSVLRNMATHSYLSLPYSLATLFLVTLSQTHPKVRLDDSEQNLRITEPTFITVVFHTWTVGTDQLRQSAFPSCFSGDTKRSLLIHKILLWFGLWSVSTAHILKVRSLAGVTVWEGDGKFRMWSLS